MSLPIVLYGATDCDDTERTRLCLRRLGVAFEEVNIDYDPTAEQFVVFINGGYRSTPTLIVGRGWRKLILTEPTDEGLESALSQAGMILNSNP